MAEIKMPALGADMVEATLLEWHVGVGDVVHRGDIIATVDTAKSALEVEALQEGRIEALLINPGTTVSVGTVIATMADSVPEVPTVTPSTSGRPASSPLARRRAAELGIDLADVQPSRPGGFIGVQDVEQSRLVVPAAVPEPSEQSDLLDARLAMNEGLRAVTASLMSRSKREIPHYYLHHHRPPARQRLAGRRERVATSRAAAVGGRAPAQGGGGRAAEISRAERGVGARPDADEGGDPRGHGDFPASGRARHPRHPRHALPEPRRPDGSRPRPHRAGPRRSDQELRRRWRSSASARSSRGRGSSTATCGRGRW